MTRQQLIFLTSASVGSVVGVLLAHWYRTSAHRPGTRWARGERRLGPFTYARDKEASNLTVAIHSGHEEYPGCTLRLRAFGHTLIIDLPPIIRPHRTKVIAKWDAATIARLGRDYYIDEDERAYGINYHNGLFNVLYGRQSGDSRLEQRWSRFLPWTQWRFVEHRLYNTDGSLWWTIPGGTKFDDEMPIIERAPVCCFWFRDFDGEEIKAKTRIEEREWHFGDGWFKWLSVFRQPKIRRDLNLEFSAEVGPRKGSWKGGTIGHSIEMNSGESIESAFTRYCQRHNLTPADGCAPVSLVP